MNKKHMMKSVLAILLTLVLVISGVNIPKLTPKAATEIDLSSYITMSGTTTGAKDNGEGKGIMVVEVLFSMPSHLDSKDEWAANNANSLIIDLTVSDFTGADGKNPGVMPMFMSNSWAWNQGTYGNLAEDNRFQLTMDIAPLNWGGNNTIGKFGLQFANLVEGSTVTYTINSVKFSSETVSSEEPGGSGGTGGITIPSGNLTDYNYDDIDYNYAKLLQYSLYFYDANMCGDEVGEKSLQSWRDDCHTYDKYNYTRGDGSVVNVDLTGGFHDAGDHVKFGLPEAYAAFVLGMSYDTNKSAYVAAKQEQHLETITTHFADYLVDCTVLNSAGNSVEAFCVQVGNGGGEYDHGYWGAPENQPQSNRTAYFSSSSAPHTDIVSLSAAALAMQYKNFGGEEYLDTAKKLFAYAKSNTKSVGTTATTFYASSNWEDDYCLAALMLYQITGDSSYKSEYDSYKNTEAAMKPYWPLGWDNVGPAVAYYAGDSSKLQSLMGQMSGKDTYGGYVCMDKWGSARYNTSMQYSGLMYDKLTSTDTYRSWAEGQMKYLLGNNAAKQCFVVGYNNYSSKYPHHRAASGYTGGDQGTKEQANVLLGALVGGQKDDGTYTDSASDYVCNEVAIDYNATLVAAAAAIYDKYSTDTTNQFVDDEYFVDSSNGAVESVSLDKTSLKLEMDGTKTSTLTPTVLPASANNKTVSWKSSDTSVATVDASGVVTAVSPGKATITVTTNSGSKTATCEVAVYGTQTAPEAPSVGYTDKTTITLIYVTGYLYRIEGGEWTENNVFSGLTPNTEYTFYQKKAASGYYYESPSSQGRKHRTLAIPAKSVALNKTELSFEIGGENENTSATLVATVSPADASFKTITWTTSDENVATVDSNGKVTAVGPGEATIRAQVNEGSNHPYKECTVTVWKTPAKPTQSPSTSTSPTKDTIILTPYEGCEYRIAPEGQWQDSNVFTGLEAGTEYTFEIRVKGDEDKNIREGEVVSIKVSTAKEGVQVVAVTGVAFDDKLSESCTITIGDADSWSFPAAVTPADATNKEIIYASSNENVAKIDQNGNVTAVGPGYTEITVTTVEGEYKDTIKLTVTKKEENTGGNTGNDSGNTGDNSGSTDGNSGNAGEEDTAIQFVEPNIKVSYRTHIQTFGWEGNAKDINTWKADGAMSGTSGKAKRLEGINIVVNPTTACENLDLGIQYTTHCQSYGWLPWSADGDMNGTEGEAKRLEAIMIQLTGEHAQYYDVYYRVHAQTYGWLGWAKNGEPSGTAGYAKRLEGIQIVVVKKGESFNQNMGNITSGRTEAFVAKAGSSPIVNYPATSNTAPLVPGEDMVNVAYRTHVQSFGWQGWKYNGQMSGTSGKAKRLEGIEIKLTNKDYEGGIAYCTHVQKYAWQGADLNDPTTWKQDGEMAGTSGEAKRLEAICITLTGEMAEHYDIYYRVHAQSFGWLGWAKNGEASGTAGYAKRLEGIQIVLVPKNGEAPAKDYKGITSVKAAAYIEK